MDEISQPKKRRGGGPRANTGGARPGAGRPPFAPTQAQRDRVKELVGFGFSHEQICVLITNKGKPIDNDTLKKHFPDELANGASEANSRVARAMLAKAEAGDVTAGIWWTKARMGWKDTSRQEVTGADGGALQIASIDASKLSTQTLAEIMAAQDAAKRG